MRDVYRYHPVKLWTEEAVYCNALFMDQVQEYLGFTSLDSIRSSVIEYDCFERVKNDYSGLHKLVSRTEKK